MAKTRRRRVLDVLEANAGDWVDGHILCHPDIGGSEGLRRLRELRDMGHVIEMRKKPGKGVTTRQYRLLLSDPTPWGAQLKLDTRR